MENVLSFKVYDNQVEIKPLLQGNEEDDAQDIFVKHYDNLVILEENICGFVKD